MFDSELEREGVTNVRRRVFLTSAAAALGGAFLWSWRKPRILQAAVALHFAHYNFCRVHQTLRVTPAMEARLTDHVWSLEELVGLLDRRNALAA